MTYTFYNTINGENRIRANVHRGVDPRTEKELWDAPIASVEDLDEAVAAAEKALKTWSRSTIEERKEVLTNMAEKLKEHAAEIEEIVKLETGKSALMAHIEVANSAGQCLYYAENYLEDEVVHEDDTVKIVQTHVPLGIVGAISPWNFPLILSSLKVISSLITGNCVIVKPSPFTPYSTMKAAELWQPLLPPGVLQCLNGGADLGAAMTSHPGIAKITFTGTIATGKRVMASCAKTLKRLTLELAGNDAAIVCEDVDVAKVAGLTAAGAFFNGGQVCVATKRVYVHESIYDEFLQEYVEYVKGNILIAEDATMTTFVPMSNKAQFDIVKNIIDDCKKNNYNIVEGGNVRDKGFWIEPTVVAKPPEDSLLVQEEQFGPIIPILSYSDIDDALKRANLANAGLGATVYSKDLKRAEDIARRLEAGSVWINGHERPHPAGYFSGLKDSGYGGEMGKQGLLSYSYTKTLHFNKD
ncbi:putative Aldehyde dehydrogenase [Scedosporium apiospermum]|uniref:aldehyde dehydrogenase (NAD(+)) n=1 Tax=Pseudallescheria apiosperma TaxID=563466 RepID=A0A084GFF9_PSEDA|nr:putative Aldehyde dehydrogenase [Scedosporium apiospermum]KEZ46071.1 putative Aldehyde dehydrogenase [Scedosporium apiospermum]